MINALLVWLLGHSWSKHFTGLLPDPRTQVEKDQDYLHEERQVIAAANPFGNVQLQKSPYPYVNQYSTSSCVPNAAGLALAVERANDTGNFSMIAPAFIYRQRSNIPGEGSVPSEMFKLYAKFGAPLFTTLPTPMQEVEANNLVLTKQMYNEAAIFKGKEFYIVKNANNIDTLAAIIQQGHAIAWCFYSTYEEWARQTPVIINKNLTLARAEVCHDVTILPYSGFMLNGTKYVCIQDSAWFGGWKFRYVSEEFIKARTTNAVYWDTVQLLGGGIKPKHVFTKNLSMGSSGPEVVALQQLLISEGLLPIDCVTGLFAGRTLAGVKAFQTKYASDILIPNSLTAPTGLFGPASIAKANVLCQ